MSRNIKNLGFAAVVSLASMLVGAAARADDVQSQGTAQTLEQLKAEAQSYEQKVQEQQQLLNRQTQDLQRLQDLLKAEHDRITALEQAVGHPATPHLIQAVSPGEESAGPSQGQNSPSLSQAQPAPQAPVGEAPKEEAPRPQIPSLPELGTVLTPEGTLVLEPSIEYDHASTNQLTFRGISIVEGILIGAINASQVENDTVIGALTPRYGITNRLEVEAKIPYVARWNTETDTIRAVTNPIIFSNSTSGNDLGDIEAAVHYQINDGHEDWPVFVGNFRYKSETGRGPFDIGFNAEGAPTSQPTGSGFNSFQPSMTVLYPSDPVVFFGNLEYDYNLAESENKIVAGNRISHFSPGNSVGGTIGMGVALNEKTSLTLGYQHFYVGATHTTINGVDTRAQSLQVGSYLFGGSYQLTPTVGLNLQALVGATRDAPDVRLIFRVPVAFSLY